MSRHPWGGTGRTLAAVVAAVALGSGCRVEVDVALDVDRDGSGEVEVAVGLDDAAVARVPELADQLAVADLEAAGWTVTGPSEEGARTWVRATKPFDRPEEAAAVLAEVSGPEGPLRGLRVDRDPTLFEDRWRFTGTADLSEGLGSFSDAALRERLDGTDVGWTEAELVAAAGRPLAEAVTLSVMVDLPGEVGSNAPGGSDGSARWQVALGEEVALTAVGRRPNVVTLLWLAVSAAAVLAFLALCVAFARRRRLGGR